MKQNWQEFLQHAGALIEGDSVTRFEPNTVAEEAALEDWLTDLSCLAVLQVSGADAGEFLQAQFSNDLKLLESEVTPATAPASTADGIMPAEVFSSEGGLNGRVQLTGYCNPKGRLLTLFWIFQRSNGDFNLLLPGELAQSIVSRLSMFVLRADVSITDITSTQTCLAVGGPKALTSLAAVAGGNEKFAASDTDTVIESQDQVFIRLPGYESSWIVLLPEQAAEPVWTKLAEDLSPVGTNRWELASTRAAMPQVRTATTDKLIPQMLNLQAVGGLSFKKGCYPGQEIVARMQYLGKLKRRMYLVEIADAEAAAQLAPDSWPQVGTALATADDADAGVIVRLAVSEAASFLALVVLKNDRPVESLSLQSHSQASLKMLDLPYSLETQ